jgi:hypothetical protein
MAITTAMKTTNLELNRISQAQNIRRILAVAPGFPSLLNPSQRALPPFVIAWFHHG